LLDLRPCGDRAWVEVAGSDYLIAGSSGQPEIGGARPPGFAAADGQAGPVPGSGQLKTVGGNIRRPEGIVSMWLISRLIPLFFDIRNHGGLDKTLNSFEGINTHNNSNETLWR
jgi:hypothetical protein